MITSTCQRWRDRRSTYRPAGEVLVPSEYDVAEIPGDAEARAFVEAHHYSGTYPAARWRVGLRRRGDLVGVAVFSHPTSDRVLTSVFPGRAIDSVELGRLVLLDEVPGNAETWFLARCFEVLRRAGVRGVVSYSDPVPRRDAAGRIVFRGHVGTIYQAHNACYLGRSPAKTLRLLADGTVLSARAIQKIRAMDRGWRYASALLEAAGAIPVDVADSRGWLRHWLPRLTTTLRHGGNHKYAWAVDRRARGQLPPSLAYPKFCIT